MASRKKSVYTDLEKNLQTRLVEKSKSVIECRKNDSRSLKAKATAWEKITAEYNKHPQVNERDVKQLKKCWDNLKSKAKKQVAEAKRVHRRTGGGTPPKAADPISDIVVSVTSDEINPLENAFDDDAEYNNEVEGKLYRTISYLAMIK